jgi:hypothetical protein
MNVMEARPNEEGLTLASACMVSSRPSGAADLEATAFPALRFASRWAKFDSSHRDERPSPAAKVVARLNSLLKKSI